MAECRHAARTLPTRHRSPHRRRCACLARAMSAAASAVLILALQPGASAFPWRPKADVFVSTAGDDAWSGALPAPNRDRSDGPFASIQRAQREVRHRRSTGQADAGLTVLVRGGTYRLREPLVFTPEDGGSEQAPVTWAAYPGERPVISGGVPIVNWQDAGDGTWTADVPEARDGTWPGWQLFVGNTRRTRCRTPNEGYLRSTGPLKPRPARNAPDWRDPECRIGFFINPADLGDWPDLDQGNAVAFHAWTASIHWLDSLDLGSRTLRFTAGSGWPMGYWEKEQRYIIENVRAALDSPGEWYVDRTAGRVYLVPMPGDRLDGFTAVVPVTASLLELRGDLEAGLTVDHLAFRGLTFEHAAFSLPRDRAHDGQAGVALGAAITTTGARHCSFEDIVIAQVGQYGFWFGPGTRHCRLVRSELANLGAGGVKIGSTASETETTACSHNLVENCLIHDGGHLVKAGVGVWIGRSSHHTVRRNRICNLDYSGVSVGWSWGYAPSTANHNTIEYNHIHHIGNGVLSDMGGIYCLGDSPGTVLRGNLIHDIVAYSYGGWGLYTDEGSTGILMEQNIVYNTKSGGFHQHYGRDNILRHNIFAFSQEPAVIRSREEEHLSFTFEKNVVLVNHGQPLGGNWSNGNFRLDGNLYWDAAGNAMEFWGYAFDEWQMEAGQDRHSLVEDPRFRRPEAGDFRLRKGSPLHMMMIRPLPDPALAGLFGPRSWTSRADRVVPRAVDPAMRPPTARPRRTVLRRIQDDFEGYQPGDLVAQGRTMEAGEATIRVSSEQSAGPGRLSLKFTDADGLEHDWQPHLVYSTSWRQGTVHAAFDVRLEPGARFWHEWRDRNSPYQVGPEIRFREDGTLTSGERVLMAYPTRQWIRVEIACPLGPAAAAQGFSLAVTPQGGTPARFDGLKTGSPTWQTLDWVGFISEAVKSSVFFLDNLDVRRDP